MSDTNRYKIAVLGDKDSQDPRPADKLEELIRQGSKYDSFTVK